MKTFIVTTKQGIKSRYEIQADSEDEAELKFLDGDYEPVHEEETDEEVIDIMEKK